ncbi:hypothetical protein B0H10DRAFT_1938033 [Mycena sp. CBHHK59/15]|nr:hypothetical protein B0H10DRAFT_1938033 [Mycena sp. CBHHK59/15]
MTAGRELQLVDGCHVLSAFPDNTSSSQLSPGTIVKLLSHSAGELLRIVLSSLYVLVATPSDFSKILSRLLDTTSVGINIGPSPTVKRDSEGPGTDANGYRCTQHYTVASGDACTSIDIAFGLPPAKLINMNAEIGVHVATAGTIVAGIDGEMQGVRWKDTR